MTESDTEIYDALIVGGGPAGASAAIRLALNGARVLLVEQKKFPRAKLCGEFISPECWTHFAQLGVIDRITKAGGVALTETVFFTRRGRSVSVPSKWFGERAQAASALGLSRAEMDMRLLARAREVGVEVLEETQALGLMMEGERVRGVRLKRSNKHVRAYSSLVTIDATGRTRALAHHALRSEMKEARSYTSRARLVAFKVHLEGARPAAGHCEIYSYRGGYGGLSSVENSLSNLCFIAAASDVKECGSDPLRVMREIVCQNKRAAKTLKDARVASAWLSVALEGFGRHELAPVEGLLTIGDAASFIDPFTGSGMLMALESSHIAANEIAILLTKLRQGSNDALRELASNYQDAYAKKFGARLRVCALLRCAAFVPRLNEAVIFALGASKRVRRNLAQATRRATLHSVSQVPEV